MTKAPVYLITVLYNSRQCVASFARSLAAQDFHQWHLIAVDNASADGCSDILADLTDQRVSIIHNAKNVGFAKAANQGMQTALDQDCEFVILINNDTVLPPQFLRLFLGLRESLGANVIVPRIMRLSNPEESWYAGGHLEYEWALKNVHEEYCPNDTRNIRTVEFASGCCLGISRDTLCKVGLLDESFFVYWEDADFCMRLKESGIEIFYVADVVIFHEGGHTSGGEFSPGFNRFYFRSYIQVVRKHFGIGIAIRTVLRISVKELTRPNRKWPQLLAMLTAMAGGLVAPLLPPVRVAARDGDRPLGE